MPRLKQHYGRFGDASLTEGPLGFPLTDKQAYALETILKALPRDSAFNYRKAMVVMGPTEVSPPASAGFTSGTGVPPVGVTGGTPVAPSVVPQVPATCSRFDVSWISTEDPDRMGEVVAAKGMSDSQFRLNPIVTLNHCYDMPPVGKSLWRKFVKGGPAHGDLRGIKAKTQYPARPVDWKENKDWPADVAFSLVQADLLRGKSIGFLPVKVHTPTTHEVEEWQARSASKGEPIAGGSGLRPISLVIDEWILLEYACVFLPAQQNAVVESVSKAWTIPDEFGKALGIPCETGKRRDGDAVTQKSFVPGSPFPPVAVSQFTRLSEIEKAIQRQVEAIDIPAACRSQLGDRLDLLRGRI